MQPGVRVDVGEAYAQQGLPGATVRSSKNRLIKTLNAGDEWFFIFKDPGDTLFVESVNKSIPVTITNHLSVLLSMEITLRDDTVLDDVLKHGRRFQLAYGARLKARI